MLRGLVLAIFLLLPVSASAEDSLEGSWALRLEGANIMRWDLDRQGDAWEGTWVKPDSFASDGERFGSIEMPAVEREADSGRSIGDWAELIFKSEDGEGEGDVFRFRLLSANRAEMIYAGTGLPPFTLQRVAAGALLGPFEKGRVYGGEQPPARAASPKPLPPLEKPAPAREPQGPPAMIGR